MKKKLLMLACFVVLLGSAAISQSSHYKATNLFTEGVTYIIFGGEEVFLYRLDGFYHTGYIRDSEQFMMSTDNGVTSHTTNIVIMAEDNWNDERKEYAVYLTDQDVILGYLYEIDVDSEYFVFEYAGYPDDVLQDILNY